MNENEFWEQIERMKNSQDRDFDFDSLIPEDKFYNFSIILTDKFKLLNQWTVCEACYLLFGGISDDTFIDCRYWIIFLGRAYYERVVSNPDVLVELVDTNIHEQYDLACRIKGKLGRRKQSFSDSQSDTLHTISGSSSTVLPLGPKLATRQDYFKYLPRLSAAVVAAGKKFPELTQ